MLKLSLLMALENLQAGDIGTSDGFCANSADVWQFIGYILMVVKIVIPIILIVLGALDLGKAVIASKDDEITKAVTKFFKRVIAAVVIFFIPTIIGLIFNLVGSFQDDVKADFDVCKECIVSPKNCQ